MNLPVFVCDDDPYALTRYRQIITSTIARNHYPMNLVIATTDVHELQDYLAKHPEMTTALFFLDIDLHAQISGIDLAAQIRQNSEQAEIVFVTAHRELAYETLKRRIAALDFIEKGQQEDAQIRDILATRNAAYRKLGQQAEQYFEFHVGSRIVRVPLASVYYIESAVKAHKVALYGENYMYEFYAKLSEIAQAYPTLMRVHKSYLINPTQITSIDFKQREIHFPDEYVCTFPVAMSRQLHQLQF